MNEQRLIDASCVDGAVHNLKELEKTFGNSYGYARGFRDCLVYLGLMEEETPQSCSSKGSGN